MGDNQYAISIKDGDEKVFNLFFKRYYKVLLAYITTFTNDKIEAEDIVQQSFVVLWEKRKHLNTKMSPKSYLFTIALNKYKDAYKQEQIRNTFLDELKESSLRKAIPENLDYLDKQIARLKSIVDTLPPRCKEILLLNKFEGLKYAQIAEHLQISVKTVESQMRIAYQKVREGFEDGVVLYLLFGKNLSNRFLLSKSNKL